MQLRVFSTGKQSRDKNPGGRPKSPFAVKSSEQVAQESRPAPYNVSTHNLIAQALRKIKEVERPAQKQSSMEWSDDELLSRIEE